MSFYIVKEPNTSPVTGFEVMGEYANLKDAEKAIASFPPGAYDMLKVVRVGMAVMDVPATRKVVGGVSTTSRPNARGPRKQPPQEG